VRMGARRGRLARCMWRRSARVGTRGLLCRPPLPSPCEGSIDGRITTMEHPRRALHPDGSPSPTRPTMAMSIHLRSHAQWQVWRPAEIHRPRCEYLPLVPGVVTNCLECCYGARVWIARPAAWSCNWLLVIRNLRYCNYIVAIPIIWNL
jgi:hypothetical protein